MGYQIICILLCMRLAELDLTKLLDQNEWILVDQVARL